MPTFVLAITLLLATGCAAQPGRDGPGRPTTSDTTRYPGEAKDPLDPRPATEDGSTDSTRVWR
jgi:hypothetical protein